VLPQPYDCSSGTTQPRHLRWGLNAHADVTGVKHLDFPVARIQPVGDPHATLETRSTATSGPVSTVTVVANAPPGIVMKLATLTVIRAVAGTDTVCV
jgi:hypothetical protein